MCTRLGAPQPSAIAIDACTCGAPVDGHAHHLRDCKVGAGPKIVHDNIRNVVHAMCVAAGCAATIERPFLVPGTELRPADVLLIGGLDGARDLAVDVTLRSALSKTSLATRAKQLRAATMVGVAARAAEHDKRCAVVEHGPYQGCTVVEALDKQDIDFLPLAFEVTGAAGDSWQTFISKISSIAHERRGLDRATFARQWKIKIAMAVARFGANAAVRRARACTATLGGADGGAEDARAPAPRE